MRWMRLTAPLGFLLACALLVSLPAVATATTTEMRGEWELSLTSKLIHAKAQALISKEATAQGEFAATGVLFEHVNPGSFEGTLESGKATVTVTSNAYQQFPEAIFTSAAMTVESNGGSLSISGEGTLTVGTEKETAMLVATRILTQQQVEEREAKEAKEKQEREEREARENIRGEWALTVTEGPQSSKGIALITDEANTKNEFASSGALFESAIPGAFSGTLEGTKASVTVSTEAYGSFPASTFTSKAITITSGGKSLSMSGEGTLTVGATTLPGATLTATRTKTYQEVKAREAKEKAEREAKEKAEQEAKAREAKEKAEREAKEKAEREAKEKAEREAREKAEREAREAAEKAALAKAGQTGPPGGSVAPALVSVQLTGKTFTVSSSGVLSLRVTNPNSYAIAGRVTLLIEKPGKAGKASRAAASKSTSLGTVSFGVSPTGAELVKIKLSKLGRTEMAHHPSMHAIATITTEASGQKSTVKTFALTLHAKPVAGKR
jgi:hypothetical protein